MAFFPKLLSFSFDLPSLTNEIGETPSPPVDNLLLLFSRTEFGERAESHSNTVARVAGYRS
jgi:hypothetical protein